MKHSVSLLASLTMALGVAACGAAAAGKPEVAGACTTKMGSETKCACFADALEKNLTPEEFSEVATAMEANKLSSAMLPNNLTAKEKISEIFTQATMSCFV